MTWERSLFWLSVNPYWPLRSKESFSLVRVPATFFSFRIEMPHFLIAVRKNGLWILLQFLVVDEVRCFRRDGCDLSFGSLDEYPWAYCTPRGRTQSSSSKVSTPSAMSMLREAVENSTSPLTMARLMGLPWMSRMKESSWRIWGFTLRNSFFDIVGVMKLWADFSEMLRANCSSSQSLLCSFAAMKSSSGEEKSPSSLILDRASYPRPCRWKGIGWAERQHKVFFSNDSGKRFHGVGHSGECPPWMMYSS